MANIGDIFASPEVGWNRYDDTDKAIMYTSHFEINNSHSGSHNNTNHYIPVGSSDIENARISFYFKGTKLRVIGGMDNTYTDQFSVTVDGKETVTDINGYTGRYKALLSEITGLVDEEHEVIIKSNDSKRFAVDCFDTDGVLLNKTQDITHKNANLTYTLPMNTTAQIKAKTGDSRAGLLGMANDPDNFGDLYVVGRDGKAHLTKSGIKSEVIFDGNASTTSTTYNLKSSYKNFKYLLFNGCTIVSGNDYARSSMMIPVEAITTSTSGSSHVFGVFHSGENRGYTIGIRFENETSFVLSSSNSSISTWSAPKIYRVDGIY